MKQYLILLCIFLGIISVSAQETYPLVYPYAENGKWGVIDKEGKIKLKPKYKEISLFERAGQQTALAVVTNEKGLKGCITRNGKLAAKIKYAHVDVTRKGKYVVVRGSNGLYGLVNTKNRKEVLKTEYKSISRFTGWKMGLAIFQKDGKYGCINEDGKIIARPIYKSAVIKDEFSDFPDVKLTKEDGTTFVMDSWGGLVKKKPQGDSYDDDMMYAVDMSVDEDFGLENKGPTTESEKLMEGNKTTFRLTTTYTSRSGQRTINIDTITGIDGVVKIFLKHYKGKGYAADFIIATKNGKTGIVNNKSEVLIPFEQEDIIEKGSQAYFILKKGALFGLADRRGRKILDPVFSKIKAKNSTYLFFVVKGSFEGYADREGHVYLPLKAF